MPNEKCRRVISIIPKSHRFCDPPLSHPFLHLPILLLWRRLLLVIDIQMPVPEPRYRFPSHTPSQQMDIRGNCLIHRLCGIIRLRRSGAGNWEYNHTPWALILTYILSPLLLFFCRSIPEAGYITLGTLRYGVRLSSASSRLSDGLSCRNSDSIDTCSVLLPSQQQQQHVTLPREGRQRLKAESPTCGNCCCGVVALATNGRCCDGSLCFSSGSSVAPQPRNSVQEQQQRRRTRHDSAVTRLPFRKLFIEYFYCLFPPPERRIWMDGVQANDLFI